MKILVISNMYPTNAFPSYGIFVKNFANNIQEEGAEIDLCVIKGKKSNSFLKLITYFIFFIHCSYKILKGSYDLIYVHYIAHSFIPIIFLKPFINKPIICNVHGEDVKLNKTIERLIERFGRRAIRKSDLIVAPSPYFEQILIKRYINIQTFVSPSGGYNSKIFYPKSPLNFNNDELHIGYISRIEKGKGWDTLIEALYSLSKENFKFKATFIGLGSEDEKLKKRINLFNLKEKVHFIGGLNQTNLGEYFRSFDVFVFPTCLDEGLGLVGIESLACGTPVIGSNVPSIKTYLKNNVNGFLFNMGDVNDLSHKIKKFNNLTIFEKKNMSQNCIELSKQFSNEKVSKSIYSKIVDIVTGYKN
jgi:glycosyltransferase involved in cell wall biosynthesis